MELRHLQSQQPSLPAQQGLQTYGQHPAPSYPPLQQLSTFTAQQPHDRSAEGSSLSEHHHQQQRPTSGGSLWQQYSSAGPQTIAAQQAQAQQVASGPDRSSGGDMLPVSQPAVQQPRYQSATTVPSVSCAAQAPDMTACSRPSTGQLPAPRPPSGRLGQPAKQAQQRPNAGPLTQHVLPAKRPAPSNASQAPSAGQALTITCWFVSDFPVCISTRVCWHSHHLSSIALQAGSMPDLAQCQKSVMCSAWVLHMDAHENASNCQHCHISAESTAVAIADRLLLQQEVAGSRTLPACLPPRPALNRPN